MLIPRFSAKYTGLVLLPLLGIVAISIIMVFAVTPRLEELVGTGSSTAQAAMQQAETGTIPEAKPLFTADNGYVKGMIHRDEEQTCIITLEQQSYDSNVIAWVDTDCWPNK